jgi:hypothetical protein
LELFGTEARGDAGPEEAFAADGADADELERILAGPAVGLLLIVD